MTQPATILRTGRKFSQVLEGAREVFMADGFEGASVDDIARAAGVSKATLYSYFPDKRILFTEVVTTECRCLAERAEGMIDASAPAGEALAIAARQFVPFLLSEFAQRCFRICMAERDRFPELGEAYYRSGPLNGRQTLIKFLTLAAERGELVIEDFGIAADQFVELCKARLWVRAIFGIQTEFSEEEIAEVVDNAVETFMARYGAR